MNLSQPISQRKDQGSIKVHNFLNPQKVINVASNDQELNAQSNRGYDNNQRLVKQSDLNLNLMTKPSEQRSQNITSSEYYQQTPKRPQQTPGQTITAYVPGSQTSG